MCLIITLFTVLATLIEVELLSVIADQLGASNMWLLLIGTAFIGWRLLSEQKQMNQKVQMQMMRGELSDPSLMMRPFVLLLSGVLLMIPGPLTDFLGLAMLHPVIGQRVLQSLFKGGLQAAMKNVQGGSGGPFGSGGGPFGSGGGPFGGGGGPFGSGGGPFGGSGGPFGGGGGLFGGGGGPYDVDGDGPLDDESNNGSNVDYSQAESDAPRDGVHPTQRPRGAPRKGRPRGPSHNRGQVDPQQVIIDVDAEVVDK